MQSLHLRARRVSVDVSLWQTCRNFSLKNKEIGFLLLFKGKSKTFCYSNQNKENMSSDPTIAELKEQIRNYELQLEQERLKQAKQREKIGQMSSEVVDSNPYR